MSAIRNECKDVNYARNNIKSSGGRGSGLLQHKYKQAQNCWEAEEGPKWRKINSKLEESSISNQDNNHTDSEMIKRYYWDFDHFRSEEEASCEHLVSK
jgi:hypothetical protein